MVSSQDEQVLSTREARQEIHCRLAMQLAHKLAFLAKLGVLGALAVPLHKTHPLKRRPHHSWFADPRLAISSNDAFANDTFTP
jgi:hypothetical protein